MEGIGRNRSSQEFKTAQTVIPGGVNSPVRAFKSVGMEPVYIRDAKGSKLYDLDGNEYIDYVCSFGPLILGHAPDRIVERICETARKGTSYGANTEIEVELAKKISDLYPSIDLIRMVNSGTEATMSAVRLARGYTGRNRIVKFEGCYHGHGDSFLIKAGSGVLTLGIPGSPGITPGAAEDTLIAGYNDIESVKRLIESHREEIAAVIVEPVVGNAGVIPPREGFLQELRDITASEGVLLIFDEVITGFRIAPGGAQELYGVVPDLTTLGKIIGGGLPVGAFGGKREIMEHLAPLGPVYQAGTLSGNPVAMAAGSETLEILSRPGFYEELEEKASYLEAGMKENLKRHGLGYSMNRVGSMMSLFFTEKAVVDFETAATADTEMFTRYFAQMLDRGIYLAPSQFEASFVSAAHSREDLDRTIEAQDRSLAAITGQGTP